MTLHDKDGGHHFHRGVVFPIESEDDQLLELEAAADERLMRRLLAVLTAMVALTTALFDYFR